jgi:uncharacterized protein (DUF885 family)
MKPLIRLAAISALFLGSCSQQVPGPVIESKQVENDATFKTIHDEYMVEFLRRNPTVNTYLGGAGLDAKLRDVDATLRDHSASALQAEDAWLEKTKQSLDAIAPESLSPSSRINRNVTLAQISFLLRQHTVRRYQERALDTYTDEPFRAVDWQLQGMTKTGEKNYGSEEEWTLLAKRVASIPAYLKVAQSQLNAGIAAKNTPDWRMLIRNGIDTSKSNSIYFNETLPKLAEERVSGPQRDAIIKQVRESSQQASVAYKDLHDFIAKTFFDDASKKDISGLKPAFRADRYAMGEEEYNWALKNNQRINKPAAQLYEEAMPVVEATRNEMVDLARKIGQTRKLALPAEGPAAVRAVFDELSKDYPKSDKEMVQWYNDSAFKLVDYARKTGIFDVPADYKLEVVETPPPLRASIDGAAYYPAPPFKNSGVGRFYLTPTDNDPAALQSNNRASLADLAAHEGFPGHDWHYKVMTQYRNEIAGVRWLTPGAVEDSSSMWEDSMATEGWALYSEALMAEPQTAAPTGFYTPEERLYQLQGKLYRDLRVRVDTGIHTGRISYADAVDLFSDTVDFLPGKCSDATVKQSDAKKASCLSAEHAIFRYSKWPTQAITYRLGKDEILSLRKEAETLLGKRFSAKAFHVLYMKQGTIPPGYFREELLQQIKATK